MVENEKKCFKKWLKCQKWLKWSNMVKQGQTWSKIIKHSHLENGRKWSK